MPIHPYKQRKPGSLEDAVADGITQAGGLKVVAGRDDCRVGRTALGKYSDPDPEYATNQIPVDVAASLMKAGQEYSGDDFEPQVLHWLARQIGYVAVPIPVTAGVDVGTLAAGLGKEAAEAFAKLAECGHPNSQMGTNISETEAATLKKELWDVAQVAVAGIQAIEAQFDETPSEGDKT